jgi:hypothetical protein
MTERRPRYSAEEFARRGDEIFEHQIRPHLMSIEGEAFVLNDIETGEYEVDRDERAASERLLARLPDAQVWMRRAGSPYARRLGARSVSGRRVRIR